MRRIRIPLLLAALLCGGCYHVTVVTGAPPAPKTIDKEWQLGWIMGLVQPPAMETKSDCGGPGVAQVETERSFLNSLASMVTYNIFSPMHTKVTCSSGPVKR